MMNKTKSPALKVAKYLLILPLTFLLIFANSCVNQDKKRDKDIKTEDMVLAPDSTDTPVPDETVEGDKDFGDVFEVVEVQPQFPGGIEELSKFLSDNIRYPTEAQEKNIQGRVIARFVVEKDGSLSTFTVMRGVDPLLDNEAIRVLKQMPKWIPGKQRGEVARVVITLPVVFRLQGEDDKKSSANSVPDKESASNNIFEVVDNQPQFLGGNEALNKWLSDNIKYPVVAQENGIQGRVIVRFVVEKDGSITDIQVVRGVDPSLDKESVRVIGTMPKWKPGTQRGQAVRTYFTLPVVYRLQN